MRGEQLLHSFNGENILGYFGMFEIFYQSHGEEELAEKNGKGEGEDWTTKLSSNIYSYFDIDRTLLPQENKYVNLILGQ